jgi:glycosyltransferase involved in cell wall biosynthesis
MKVIVWQLKPSMHQLALVKALQKKCDVIWIMQFRDLSPERKEMGWSKGKEKPDFYLETAVQMRNFIDTQNAQNLHLFGGFNASKELNIALKYCVQLELNVFVQSEAYRYGDLFSNLKSLKFIIDYQIYYKNKIKGVFAIGSLGVDFFTSRVGFPPEKVFPFGYFIDPQTPTISDFVETTVKIIFVGQLIKRKGVEILFKCLDDLKGDWELNIVGNGPLKKGLERRAKEIKKGRINFLGVLPNREAQEFISNSDILILPSLWDGWGAVVNEALMVGTPVILSDKCGSNILIRDFSKGIVVRAGSIESLTKAITKRIAAGKVSSSQRNKLSEWAQSNINGEIAASYVIDCMNQENTKIPWV